MSGGTRGGSFSPWGEHLRRLIRASGHATRKDFCKSVEITETSLHYWERGERLPSLTAAVKVAAGLGITLDELVGGPELGISLNSAGPGNSKSLPATLARFLISPQGRTVGEAEFELLKRMPFATPTEATYKLALDAIRSQA